MTSARLLDVSRLASRAGQVLTGIDRVELAYLKALRSDPLPLYGLARTPLGFLLLDESGLDALLARLDNQVPWGEASRFARIFSKLDSWQQRALSDLRAVALARCTKRRLGRMLKQHLPQKTTYVNTGHTNFTDFVISGVKQLKEAKLAVFLHDTIPLDHPETQREDSVSRFERFMARVSAHADLVIYNSAATEEAARPHFKALGHVPQGLVAHLGIEMPKAEPEAVPDGLLPQAPYFVTVSTLEARKGHAFLLKLWERLEKQTPPQEMPHLILVGKRGWKNDEFFYRFDNSQLNGSYIHEAGPLPDGAVASLLDGAAGALFPSSAEGYGLPVFEALARGTPVICTELPVFREVAKDIPIYASRNDSYLWLRQIMTLSQEDGRESFNFQPPGWDAHFKLVLRFV